MFVSPVKIDENCMLDDFGSLIFLEVGLAFAQESLPDILVSVDTLPKQQQVLETCHNFCLEAFTKRIQR